MLCLLPLVFIRGGGRIAVSQTAVVDFLSVGQGDCSVIRTKNGSTYLIDCGSTSVRSVGEYRLKPWLKYHGISQLEAVFLSHPDSDHTNGVLELLEKTNEPDDWYRGEIQIKNLVLPAAYREEDGFVAMYELAVDRNIPVFWFDTGDTVAEEDIIFTCLHPIETYSVYDTNDASMVLMVECADTIVFFPGDIGGGGEEQVIGAVQDRVSQKQVFDKEIGHQGQQQTVYAENKMNGEGQVILKVAHHGSRNSTSEAFLNVLQPDIAVISCGKDNSFGHPHEETLERVQKAGCDIVSTPELGTVTVWIGRTGTTVTGYKSGVHR